MSSRFAAQVRGVLIWPLVAEGRFLIREFSPDVCGVSKLRMLTESRIFKWFLPLRKPIVNRCGGYKFCTRRIGRRPYYLLVGIIRSTRSIDETDWTGLSERGVVDRRVTP